jgi:hypothetical protein
VERVNEVTRSSIGIVPGSTEKAPKSMPAGGVMVGLALGVEFKAPAPWAASS